MYRSADLGALEASKPLPIVIRYTEVDARPSTEILKPKAAEPPAATRAASTPPTPSGTSLRGWAPGWALALLAVALLAVAASLIAFSRRPPPAPPRRCRTAHAS